MRGAQDGGKQVGSEMRDLNLLGIDLRSLVDRSEADVSESGEAQLVQLIKDLVGGGMVACRSGALRSEDRLDRFKLGVAGGRRRDGRAEDGDERGVAVTERQKVNFHLSNTERERKRTRYWRLPGERC